MGTIAIHSILGLESVINSAIALAMVIGLSVATDFWKEAVTQKFPDGDGKPVPEMVVDATPAIKKSARITYGRNGR